MDNGNSLKFVSPKLMNPPKTIEEKARSAFGRIENIDDIKTYHDFHADGYKLGATEMRDAIVGLLRSESAARLDGDTAYNWSLWIERELKKQDNKE